MNILNWNIAAVNNNPFEYWITHSEPAYNGLMEGVQGFLDAPGELDVPIKEVFRESMAQELFALMEKEGWDGVAETKAQWESNFAPRKMVSGFMQDKEIGSKRLASMPDRVTNTIFTTDGGQVCRPTLINVYEGKMDTVGEWWEQWKEFMFVKPVSIKSKSGETRVRPCQMLEPISSKKYPAVTPQEEAISIPLQTLCQAVFDAVLVHIVNAVAPGTWHPLKLEICNALVKNKDQITLDILANSYADSHVVFLQEAAGVFIDRAGTSLGDHFHILAPAKLDSKRDQNSLILLSKSRFDAATVEEVTAKVTAGFAEGTPVADGDMFAVTVRDKSGGKYFLASFHGDTNGLATIPVVSATKAFYDTLDPEYKMLFGLDANTHQKHNPGKVQGMLEFVDFFVKEGLTSCWGNSPDPKQILTTFNARTFLQPQLNKAVRMSEKESKGDVNPKDFILFHSRSFRVDSVLKDNTGERKYIEGMVFPTLTFPSDHGIVRAVLEPQLSDKSEL